MYACGSVFTKEIAEKVLVMIENIKKLQELLDCEVIPVAQNTDPKQLVETYLNLWQEGKEQKFTPVIVTADDILLEKFELDLEDEDLDFTKEGMKTYREKILAEAQKLNGADFYKEEKKEFLGEVSVDEIQWEVPEGEELMFSAYLDIDYDDESKSTIKKDVVTIKLPTEKSYEAFAWLPMGGFNDCPLPAEMTAMAKYWHEKHGAEPATITYDTVEFYLNQPVSDKEALVELAIEQYLFDVDIVEQGVGDVESLVETLYQNKQWYFWWD